MNSKDFTAVLQLDKPAHDVFTALTSGVSKWWGGDDLSGSSIQLNDEFIIHHPGSHYSKQKLIEIIPNRKIVWLVTDSELHWLKKNRREWTNTKMVFEVKSHGDKTELFYTHEGLTPEKECYDRVSAGWTTVIHEWLYDYITYGKAHF